MPADSDGSERERTITSTRAAALWLALVAVVVSGLLLLALWSTKLGAGRSVAWRWGTVGAAAIALLLLGWAVKAAAGADPNRIVPGHRNPGWHRGPSAIKPRNDIERRA